MCANLANHSLWEYHGSLLQCEVVCGCLQPHAAPVFRTEEGTVSQ